VNNIQASELHQGRIWRTMDKRTVGLLTGVKYTSFLVSGEVKEDYGLKSWSTAYLSLLIINILKSAEF
jgi:hypothetical protein